MRRWLNEFIPSYAKLRLVRIRGCEVWVKCWKNTQKEGWYIGEINGKRVDFPESSVIQGTEDAPTLPSDWF